MGHALITELCNTEEGYEGDSFFIRLQSWMEETPIHPQWLRELRRAGKRVRVTIETIEEES